MRPACLGARARQAFAAEGLALHHRANLVAIDVEIPHPRALFNKTLGCRNAAVQAKCQAKPGRIDIADNLAKIFGRKPCNMQDWAEVLALEIED